MFRIVKSYQFEAAHRLEHHDGKCLQLHGHAYTLEVELKNETISSNGPKKNMLVDFGEISCIVKPMIDEYFDHQYLNETLLCDSPTCEYIASWIFQHLKEKIPHLQSVCIYETRGAKASFSRK